MKRPLHLFNELRHIVQRKSRPELTKVAGRHLEHLPLRAAPLACQPATQRLVHNVTKRAASAARFRLKLGCHIIIQGQSRSHILML